MAALIATLLSAIALVTTFALWLTLHLVLCARLAVVLRPKVLVALLVLPPTAALAGYWGMKFGHKRLVACWGVCIVGYVIAWIALASHS